MKSDTIAKFKFNNLAEFLQAANDMIRFSGINPLLVHLEPAIVPHYAGTFTVATLVEETLTDDSKVYSLRIK